MGAGTGGDKLSSSSTLSLSTSLGHGIERGWLLVAVGGGGEQRSRTQLQDVSPAVKLSEYHSTGITRGTLPHTQPRFTDGLSPQRRPSRTVLVAHPLWTKPRSTACLGAFAPS